MVDFYAVLWLALVLLIDWLLAAGGSALKSSHPSRLQEMREAGLSGAGLAQRLASQATRLLLTLRFGHGLLRLLAIGLTAVIAVRALSGAGPPSVVPTVAALAGVWVLLASGEFLLENLVLRAPEGTARRLAPFLWAVAALATPAVRLMEWLGRRMARDRAGARHPLVTEEQIMMMVDAGEEGGAIEEEEKAMIYSVFQLGNTLAREIMVPRIDIVAFEDTAALREATDVLLQTGHSRAPVYSGSIDNVVGLIYIKDLLGAWREGRQDETVAPFLREALFVPEAKVVDELLAELQVRRVHMAVVVDEYGGTAGLVTIEDIVEEIVGEIRDEYDAAEEASFQPLGDGEFLFSGGIDLDDVNQIAEADLPKDTSDTLGGFIYGRLGRVPNAGEVVEAGGLRLVVEQVVGRRIRRVRATALTPPLGEPNAQENRQSAAK